MSLRGNETGAKSCAGITYFTSAMKAAGRHPLCIGRPGKIMTDVPLADVVEQTAKQPKEDAKAIEFTYACLGYSQTTPNMEKLGMLPLCDVGMRFTVLRAPKRKIPDGEDEALVQHEETRPKKDEHHGIQPLAPTTSYWEYWSPIFQKYAKGAYNFWTKGLEDYPRKFIDFQSKSVEFQKKIASSMQKQANFCVKFLLRFSRDIISWWLPR